MDELMKAAGQDTAADWNERARKDAMYYIDPASLGEPQDFNRNGLWEAIGILTRVRPHVKNWHRVLEVGCGIGRILQFTRLAFDEAAGIDVSPEMIRQAKQMLGSLNINLDHMVKGAFPPGLRGHYFDLVYITYVLEHIPSIGEARSVVDRSARMLKKDGVFHLNVGVFETVSDGHKPNTWDGHRWTEREVDALIDGAGLEIVSRDHILLPGQGWNHYWTTSRLK